jgi:hypothetical protein
MVELVSIAISVFVGAITFSGSIVAMAKLQGWLDTPGWTQSSLRHAVNLALAGLCLVGAIGLPIEPSGWALWLLLAASTLLGIGVTLPIGGADMPVVISLLNSYSGVAAAAAGFVVGSQLLIVAGAMVFVVLVMVYFVIPKIKQFLKNFNSDLPPITQFVVNTSDFFIHYWYAILGISFAAYLGTKKILQTTKGRLWFDRTILKVPAVGKVLLFLELNNFCVILELLLASGIPLLESLETLKGSQKNQLFKNALGDFKLEISKGGSLTKGMEKHPIFPHTLRNLINIGEETGRLSPILKRLGRYYHVQLNYLLENLSKALEPILLFMVFICVLILARAVFLPIWKMNAVIKPK